MADSFCRKQENTCNTRLRYEMSTARYPALASVLEKRIAQGDYLDKIPTVRELAAEFRVSRQTVTLALRPLVKSGLLKPEGRRGIRIVKAAAASGVIGLVASGDMSIMESDSKLMELQQQINHDGYESVLIGVTSWISPRSVCSLIGDHFAGMIFTNSTLSFEVAEHLDKHAVPFVSCNRLPVYPHINTVETDWAGSLRKLTGRLVREGYRSFGLFFPGRLEDYGLIIRREWLKIKEDFGIPAEKYDNLRLDSSTSINETLIRYLRLMHDDRNYPECLLVWNGMDDSMVRLLTKGLLALPEDTCIIGMSKKDVVYPDRIITVSDGEGYHRTLFAAYEALREIMIAPTARKIHRSIEFQLDCNHILNEVRRRKKTLKKD